MLRFANKGWGPLCALQLVDFQGIELRPQEGGQAVGSGESIDTIGELCMEEKDWGSHYLLTMVFQNIYGHEFQQRVKMSIIGGDEYGNLRLAKVKARCPERLFQENLG